jgi:hypothetical protein
MFIFWAMKLCSLLFGLQSCESTCYPNVVKIISWRWGQQVPTKCSYLLSPQGALSNRKMETKNSSEKSVPAATILQEIPWRWRQQIHTKCCRAYGGDYIRRVLDWQLDLLDHNQLHAYNRFSYNYNRLSQLSHNSCWVSSGPGPPADPTGSHWPSAESSELDGTLT